MLEHSVQRDCILLLLICKTAQLFSPCSGVAGNVNWGTSPFFPHLCLLPTLLLIFFSPLYFLISFPLFLEK